MTKKSVRIMSHEKFREELSVNLIKEDQKVEKILEKTDKKRRC